MLQFHRKNPSNKGDSQNDYPVQYQRHINFFMMEVSTI